ncbi:hypothetical protein TNIN_463631 [Trichonephila inaurata madagascariensis]|uniref:Uncharacterized protein n=1 Tax=Trichonephila inaurata madagascariensis TaxID=2747483 RepID=A0A8X6YRM2_9ARAC|nr:hypothetical protein TNIN_463631 [Trichonephila inaurata madagascariensis]
MELSRRLTLGTCFGTGLAMEKSILDVGNPYPFEPSVDMRYSADKCLGILARNGRVWESGILSTYTPVTLTSSNLSIRAGHL